MTTKQTATKQTATKPAPRPTATRRDRAEGGQTGAEGVAAPAAPTTARPSQDTDGRRDGSPAPSTASSPRNTLVRFAFSQPSPVALAIVGAVFALLAPAEVDALARALLAFVKARGDAAWLGALAALDATPHREHGRRILGALGAGDVDLAMVKRPESFGDDLFATVLLTLDARRQRRNPDLDAVLRDVAHECEMDSNGDLAIGVCGAQRIARGELAAHEQAQGADAVPDTLGWLLVYLRRDYRHACDRYRQEYAAVESARRNDPPDVLARRVANLRRERAALVRVAALAGRVAAAVAAVEPAQ